jgi:glycosyltransferase involved in cell wall biosynthesis
MLLLSLCIATYNRADFIVETLDSIIPQLTGEVEVLVVDGASTDDTEEVMHDYLQRCERIRYVRLPIKGGVDNDYNQAVEYARGEYCWLFTDDDIAKPGAIQAVLNQIKQGYDLIIVNAEVRNSDLSALLEDKRLPILKDRTYFPNDFEKFFIDNGNYMSFIGCVVIKRNIWQEREREKYYGSEFIHLGVIFQKNFESAISVISTPYISIRLGNAQWTTRAFEIWILKWPKLIWSFEFLTDTAKTIVSPREPWRKLTTLTHLRAQGNFGLEEYCRFVRPRISSLGERAIIRTIAFIPGCLLNLLAIIYYSFKSRHGKIVFFVLKQSKFYYLNTVINIFCNTNLR